MPTKRKHERKKRVPDAKAKKRRTHDSEFNGTLFKSMLKDSSKALKGLETFVAVAKDLPQADLYDVVEGYIKISAECSEIFALLEEQNKAESELTLIFQSLEAILLRTASDLSHLSVVGNTIVRKMVSTHMKLLQTSLQSSNHRFVRQCVCLLSALVSQGTEAARDIFSQVHLLKSLCGLAQRRDKTGKPDIRMAYIQFVLSFLISGDNATIAQVLDSKDFLMDVISSGLIEDRLSSVNLILSTLLSRVVQNKSITKTQKVRFFNATALGQIASLYRWNGILDANVEEKGGGKWVVREQTHHFLLELCCSRKHGITFNDASLGTAGRPGNLVLLQFVVRLHQATEDEMIAELLVKVLEACPDLLARFFKETQLSFAPRHNKAWQDNISLLKKIYEAQPEVSKVFQTREAVPLPHLLSMVLVTTIPSICNKAFFSQGLNLSSMEVLQTTLTLLVFILKRVQKNIDICLEKSAWENTDVYSTEQMEEFVLLFKEDLSKILPDVLVLVSCWQWCSKEKMIPGKSIKQGSEDMCLVLVKGLLLQVMRLYQSIVPHLISQSKFDFSKLLKGIVTERGMKEEVPPLLQFQILQLALELPASKFSWFRVQEMKDQDLEKSEKSVFYLLIKMFLSSNNGYLKSSTRKLVLKVLRDSGVFEHTWRELELWLDHLTRLDQSQQEAVVQFLDHVLMRVVCMPHMYTEKAASAVQEAANHQASLNPDGDDASIPISHIDDVLDMVDVIVEGSEGDVEEIGPTLNDDIILQTFPFSPVIPAALETRNKLPACFIDHRGVLLEYLSNVLCDVLHSQRDPLALCLILQQYDKELSTANPASSSSVGLHASISSFQCYYSQWLPKDFERALCQTEALPASPGFTTLLKACFTEGPEAITQNSFKDSSQEALKSLDESQIPMAANQVLFYIRSSVLSFNSQSKGTAEAALAILMGLLNSLILKLLSFKTSEEPDETKLFLESTPINTDDHKQTLLAVLKAVFKHPVLEQWFLALELGCLPPHSLNPVRLKRMCGCLSERILMLLETSGVALQELDALETIRSYLNATHRAVMKEIQERSICPEQESLSLRVLLSLQQLLDPCALRELMSSILRLPQECLVSPEQQLSVYGRAALMLLSESISNEGFPLSAAHLKGLAALLISCQSSQLENFLLQVLSKEPGSAKLLQTDVLLHCLRSASPTTQEIGNLLLQNCSTHMLCFEQWCLENELQISSPSTSLLFLLRAYLKRAAMQDHTRPREIQESVLKTLRSSLLQPLWLSLKEGESGESAALQVEVLSALLQLAAESSDLTPLMSELPAILQRADTMHRWMLADAVSERLGDGSESLSLWRVTLLSAALKALCSVYKQNPEPRVQLEEALLFRLQPLTDSPESIKAHDWNAFVKSGLKHRYRDSRFLGTLSSLLEVVYGSTGPPGDLVPLSSIHMMCTSHSLFLPTMLMESGYDASLQHSRTSLVSLLLALVRKCPKVCTSNHFLVLLGAYGATLSSEDQELLLLLQEYEKNGISLVEFQYVLWGPAAVEHHRTRASLGPSLWQKPSSDQLLSLLAPERMMNTVTRFPQQRFIPVPQEDKKRMFTPERDDGSALYDPCFLLPLFSFILRPECSVDCLKFVSSHALGVTVAALSSFDRKVRAAAYHVLGCYGQHLECARFREKNQLLYLLETLRNSIWKRNVQVPFVHAIFVAKAVQQLLRPEEHMYTAMNSFLLGTQFLDLNKVPSFFKLFYSNDLEHREERRWMLDLLENSVGEQSMCLELFDSHRIFQTLLTFGSTPLCDLSSQIQIVRILHEGARVSRGAYVLVKEYGLLTWVLQIANRRNVDGKLLSAVIELIHTLWFTNLGDKESKPQGKYLPLPFINHFLCSLLMLSRLLGAGGSAVQLKHFLKTLSSVLVHCGTVVKAHDEMGWLTLHSHTLSCTESLRLLQRWAALAHDAPLLVAIHALGMQHDIKELTGSSREKGQGKRAPPPGGKNKHTEHERDETLARALLHDCKPLLRNILLHWRPDSSPLHDSASSLILRWSLRTLAEDPYEEKSTLAIVRWISEVVLPRRSVVDAVLLDEGMRKDLLRLFHLTAEDQRSSVEALQMFCTVILGLLEERRHSTLQEVMRTCWRGETEDQDEREAGLKLLALGLYELWSGAESPELLLAHAALICSGTPSTNHTQSICSALLAALGS